jgi:hypothetical protein
VIPTARIRLPLYRSARPPRRPERTRGESPPARSQLGDSESAPRARLIRRPRGAYALPGARSVVVSWLADGARRPCFWRTAGKPPTRGKTCFRAVGGLADWNVRLVCRVQHCSRSEMPRPRLCDAVVVPEAFALSAIAQLIWRGFCHP